MTSLVLALLLAWGSPVSGSLPSEPLQLPASLQPVPPALRVEITGLDSSEGRVRVALFDSEATFTRTAREAAVLRILGRRAVWELPTLPPGRYAVAAFHDEDADGDMDRGLFGIPSEPYGFSNGARGLFGPPRWSAASFVVGAGGTTVEVPVR